MKKALCITLVLAALTGCTTIGKETPAADLAGIAPGVTELEVLRRLGAPASRTVAGDKTTLVYSHTKGTPHASSYIPFIGPFLAGVDVETKSVTLEFRKGVLVHREDTVQRQTTTLMR